MRVGTQAAEVLDDWSNAARYSSNLSELELTLGDVPAAVRDAERSVIFGDRSGEWAERMIGRTTLASALHQIGQAEDALARFHEAEEVQAEQHRYPLLYSLAGFQYCDLLVARAERAAWHQGTRLVRPYFTGTPRTTPSIAASAEELATRPERPSVSDYGREAGATREVERRAAQTLKEAVDYKLSPLLDLALDHLTLARAELYRAILEGAPHLYPDSEIRQAVDGLRRAGQLQYLPLGLLTRAWLRFLQGDPDAARADLDEAQEIAERGPMPLHLADVHLHRARLFRDRTALAAARKLIEKHGYWRRKEELEDAEAAARGW